MLGTTSVRRHGLKAAAFSLLVLLPQFRAPESLPTFSTVVDLTTDQPVYLTLDIPQDQTYVVNVHQHHIDIVTSVVDAAQETLFTINSPLGREGVESFVVSADSPRPVTLRLEIRPDCLVDGPVTVDYRLLKPAEITSQLLYQDAARAFTSLDSPAEAARLYRQAAAGFADNADTRRAADALFAAGFLEINLARRDSGRKLLRHAEKRYKRVGNTIQRGWIRNKLGMSYAAASDWTRADKYFQRAYALHQHDNYLFGMGVITNNRGLLQHRRSELNAAMGYYQEALAYFRQEGETWEVANTLNNIGGVWSMLGEPLQARKNFDAALSAAMETGSETLATEIRKNMAQLLRGQGQYQEALGLYLKVLPEFRKQENLSRVASTLNNLGSLYNALGDSSRAVDYYREALPLRRQSGHRAGELSTLNNLGAAFLKLGNIAAATENHTAALKIARDIDDPRGKLATQLHIARTLTADARPDAAAVEIERTLKMLVPTSDPKWRAEALHLRGLIHHQQEHYQIAIRDFLDAASLWQQQGLVSERARSLIALADSAYQSGDADTARTSLNQALAAIESLRQSLLTPDLQASLLADLRLAGELDIELTMARYEQTGNQALAIDGLERAEANRMRIFGAMLVEASTQIRKSVDPSLIEQHAALSARLRFKANRKLRAADNVREELEEQTHALLTELDALEARIRRSHPDYAQLTATKSSTFAQLRAEIPDGVVVLQYALGKRRSWLWLYGRDTFHAIELAGSDVIEAAAVDVYTRLSRFDPRDRTATQSSLRKLADLIIIPASRLINQQRLYVVADGALHFVPFAALPIDDTDRPLIQNYELSFLPSLTVAAQLPERPIPPQPQVSILADPDYGDDKGPARLPGSADEAQAIAATLPAARLHASIGIDARREVLYSKAVASSDIVHIAAHGTYDQNDPALSGIVLARVDANGNDIDGFVGLPDVHNLELNAALVVLSGCQTALGKSVRGEGLVGLTRAFMYAGSPQVIASLWQVQDRTTAVFMRHLYRGLLHEGLSPAAALRLAQRTMSADRESRNPYFWAGLTLHGN